MTLLQAQLRAFIPLMLKYSTGRGKPGWGKESTKPPWWPKHVPWANVRMDARTDEEKTRVGNHSKGFPTRCIRICNVFPIIVLVAFVMTINLNLMTWIGDESGSKLLVLFN